MTVREHGVKFRVAFEGSHKTGFFCDQRDNRRELARYCADRTVLDPRNTYSVSARIIADGRLAWISDSHHPVTIDSARDLELVLIAVPEGDQPT